RWGRGGRGPCRAWFSQWDLDVACGQFEFVWWWCGVARAFEEVRDGFGELVKGPHAGLEGGAPVGGVLEEGDGAGVDEEGLAVDVPGFVGGEVGDHWRDHVGVELLDAVGVGVAVAAGDGGDEASPGAGGDGVAGDAVTAEMAGESAGEAGDGRLGGAVVGLAGVAPEAGLRAEVDDAAVALLSHEDGGRLDRGEVALEVHGHDLVPLLLAHVEDHAVAEDAG